MLFRPPVMAALIMCVLAIGGGVCFYYCSSYTRAGFLFHWHRKYRAAVEGREVAAPTQEQAEFLTGLCAAAKERTEHKITYDSSYFELDYPGGDVPENIGVCADVIVRSYRALGVDLQRLIHEDMRRDFNAYPHIWLQSEPDPSIDHRRVQNLITFFVRRGAALPVTDDPADYLPGDVVAWRMYNRRLHIGIVVDEYVPGKLHRMVVHNIGKGPKIENRLFRWPILGQFRYCGE